MTFARIRGWVLAAATVLLAAGMARAATVSIPVLNGDFELPASEDGGISPTDTNQAMRAGPIGWDKMWVTYTDGRSGTNNAGEGTFGALNSTNAYFANTSDGSPGNRLGTLPAPANGKQFMFVWPGNWENPPATTVELPVTVYFWTDGQTDRTHGKTPPHVPLTNTVKGTKYTATVALGNPLNNAKEGNTAFPSVQLGFVLNTKNIRLGDLVASNTQTGGVASGAWKDLSVSWTAPQSGDALDILIVVKGFTQLKNTKWGENAMAFDNVRLTATAADVSEPATATPPQGGKH
jgi:hypothetical protein